MKGGDEKEHEPTQAFKTKLDFDDVNGLQNDVMKLTHYPLPAMEATNAFHMSDSKAIEKLRSRHENDANNALKLTLGYR